MREKADEERRKMMEIFPIAARMGRRPWKTDTGRFDELKTVKEVREMGIGKISRLVKAAQTALDSVARSIFFKNLGAILASQGRVFYAVHSAKSELFAVKDMDTDLLRSLRQWT